MKKLMTAVALSLVAAGVEAQSYSKVAFGFIGMYFSVCDWDNDGDLDFVVNTIDEISYYLAASYFRNDGGTFAKVHEGPPFEAIEFTWSDFDNDNLLDHVSSEGVIHMNVPPDFVVNNAAGVSSLGDKYSTGDIDNDNDVDIVRSSRIFWNNGGAFAGEAVPKTPFLETLIDYDNNGRSEMLVAEGDGASWRTLLMAHGPSGWAPTAAADNPELYSLAKPLSARARDFDHDLDMDLLLEVGDSLVLLENADGRFSIRQKWRLPNRSYSWTDLDNNGYADIVIQQGPSVSTIIFNDHPSWRTETIPFHITAEGGNFGDLDNDGDVDILNYMNADVYWLKNTSSTSPFQPNQPPSAPGGLSVTRVADTTYFHWEASTDDTTPQQALTYNLCVGGAPGMTDAMSPLADLATGRRRVVGPGNADANLGWKLVGLPCGTYHWSVQAIDNSHAGGAFAPWQSFAVPCGVEASGFCAGAPTAFATGFADAQSALWHFGDGRTSAELEPEHTYDAPGSYLVRLELTRADGSTRTEELPVEILARPAAPGIEHD